MPCSYLDEIAGVSGTGHHIQTQTPLNDSRLAKTSQPPTLGLPRGVVRDESWLVPNGVEGGSPARHTPLSAPHSAAKRGSCEFPNQRMRNCVAVRRGSPRWRTFQNTSLDLQTPSCWFGMPEWVRTNVIHKQMPGGGVFELEALKRCRWTEDHPWEPSGQCLK